MISVTIFAIAAAMSAGQPVPTAKPAVAVHGAASLKDVPLQSGEGRAVATKLADELTQNFVYPEQGGRYAAMLRANAAAGKYDAGSRGDLATRMTADLMAVQKDGHLGVSVAEPRRQRDGGEGEWKGPPLIQSAKWLAPGVAYIRFTAFMSTDEEVVATRAFMAKHSDAKTMIFDLRNHHGGRLGEMDEIFPYLFAARTPLVTLEMPRSIFDRHGSPFGEAATLEFAKDADHVRATHFALPGKATPLRDATIYLLTSNVTGSAGEHFALAFKSTGRGTLIGEATAGANHFGGPTEIGEHFTAFMPVGRTFDIKTGKDWEGVGVAPDVAVPPETALVVALEEAGLSATEARRIDATEKPAEPVHRDKLRAR